MSRAELAGIHMGLVIVEMVNLMYQNNTAKNFLLGLQATITAAIEERKGT